MRKKRFAILISGRGSNMQALITACKAPSYPAEAVLVLSDRENAAGLQRAQEEGIATSFLDPSLFTSREAFDRALDEQLRVHRIDLVCLAGFMRLLSPCFAEEWTGRLLNIHPSLLPAFRGLNTHARALAEGVKWHGCTVHFVTAALDAGPIIAQACVPVLDEDTPETLAARVLAEEHRLYPLALAACAEETVHIQGQRVLWHRMWGQESEYSAWGKTSPGD